MTSQELLDELKIRFDTSPKLYEKADFKVLLALLTELVSQVSNCTSAGSAVVTIANHILTCTSTVTNHTCPFSSGTVTNHNLTIS